jgi:hypothetical protein
VTAESYDPFPRAPTIGNVEFAELDQAAQNWDYLLGIASNRPSTFRQGTLSAGVATGQDGQL